MFGRLTEVLQSAADVVAPNPSAIHDFEYHWKLVKNFYSIDKTLPKVHLDDTNIPNHLEKMLIILIKEEQHKLEAIEKNKNICITSECLNFLLNNRLLDILVELAITDTPPGARISILNWTRRLLSCLENPPINHASLFQPIQKLIQLCNGKSVSPYESEEILFLVTVSGIVRKDPFLVHIFLPAHQHSANISSAIKGNLITKMPTKNSLFDCNKIESNIRRISIIHDDNDDNDDLNKGSSDENDKHNCDKLENNKEIEKIGDNQKIESNNFIENEIICDCEEGERLKLLDAILSYFESPDTTVVVRACEGALILASLSTINTNCSAVESSLKYLCRLVVDKIVHLCQRIPEDMDLCDIDELIVSWGLIPRDSDVEHFIGRPQLYEFLCWIDYCDCLARECNSLKPYLGVNIRKELLETVIEPLMIDDHAAFMTIIATKIIRQFHSITLTNEIANWLVGDCKINEINGSDSFLSIIIENAQDTNNTDVLFQTLQFIEALLDNPNERVLHGMIFYYINNRGYFDGSASQIECWSDEEEEREKRQGNVDKFNPIKSRTLAPSNILKIINSFLLLIPRQIIGEGGGTCYEEYVQDASRHYQSWIKRTEQFRMQNSEFAWPIEAVSLDRKDATPESISPSTSLGLTKTVNSKSATKKGSQCNDSGIEESFNEGPLLKMLFSHIKNMTSQQYELNLAIIAILSKLALLPHPYLHEILLRPDIPACSEKTLWSNLQSLARKLLMEIPRVDNFQNKIIETGKRLLSNAPISNETVDESDPLFESIIVLEEFCKELAAIAFVKFHHATE